MKIKLLNVNKLGLACEFSNGDIIEVEACDCPRAGYFRLKDSGNWFLILSPFDVVHGENVSWEKVGND